MKECAELEWKKDVSICFCGYCPQAVEMDMATKPEGNIFSFSTGLHVGRPKKSDLYGPSLRGLIACNYLVGHDSPESLSHLADALLRAGRAEDDGEEARRGRYLAKVLEDDRVLEPRDQGHRLVHKVDGGHLDVARLRALRNLLDEQIARALKRESKESLPTSSRATTRFQK